MSANHAHAAKSAAAHNAATIGRHIRAARQARRLTQDALAAAARITRPHLAKIEAGTYALKAGTLFAIADALAVTADEIRQGSLLACAAGDTVGDATKPTRKASKCPPRSKSTGQTTKRQPASRSNQLAT